MSESSLSEPTVMQNAMHTLSQFGGYASKGLSHLPALLAATPQLPFSGPTMLARQATTPKDENYTNYRSSLAKAMEIDEENKAELLFVNAMARLMPQDDSIFHVGALEDKTWTQTFNYMAGFLPSAVYSAHNATLGQLSRWVVEKCSPHFTYGDALDPQAKRASYAAMGLMTGQYLSLMSKTEKVGDGEYAYELAELRDKMYQNILSLTADDDVVQQHSPLGYLQNKIHQNIAASGFEHAKADDEEALNAARDTLQNHLAQSLMNQNASYLQLTQLDQFYTHGIETLCQNALEHHVVAPSVINLELQKIRLHIMHNVNAPLATIEKEAIEASNQLFDMAEQLELGIAIDESPLKQQAQILLESIVNAGAIKHEKIQEEKDASLEGTTVDDGIQWQQLKQQETTRISAIIAKQNDELSYKLQKMVENYHKTVNAEINAANRILRLGNERACIALANQHSGAEAGDPHHAIPPKTLASVDILTKVIHHGFADPKDPNKTIPGIQGPAWNITFEASDKDNKDSLHGQYNILFKDHSKFAKQQGIIDQASLISLSSKSITFTAEGYIDPSFPNGKRQYSKEITIEMALMQAIAVQSTTDLDPSLAKFKLLIGYDKNTNPVYATKKVDSDAEDPMLLTLDELFNYDSKSDANVNNRALNIRVADHFKPGSELFINYQKALEARAISEAGSRYIHQTSEPNPQHFAPQNEIPEHYTASQKRQHIAEQLVFEQHAKVFGEYKNQIKDKRETSEVPADTALAY